MEGGYFEAFFEVFERTYTSGHLINIYSKRKNSDPEASWLNHFIRKPGPDVVSTGSELACQRPRAPPAEKDLSLATAHGALQQPSFPFTLKHMLLCGLSLI